MSRLTNSAISWTEMGLVPDAAIRAGIRRLLARRLDEIGADDIQSATTSLHEFVRDMRIADIAPQADRANEQHYEVPQAFFAWVLGPHQKYSCCYWDEETPDLESAERRALEVTCSRAQIEDGMTVLDLGCGWGSLTLWIAEHYPETRVTAVSNSRSQRDYIIATAKSRGLDNVAVLTRDMNAFEAPEQYDRIVSVEMFEHMRNYELLFGRIASWLKPEGRFFMHIFCHRLCAYPFEDRGPADWMSRHFFSGGIMPSADLPLFFQRDLNLVRRWSWDGRHYEKTANAWLRRLDENRGVTLPVLNETYGDGRANQWFHRWRLFFMACAELFGYADGQEWFVGHYLFERPRIR